MASRSGRFLVSLTLVLAGAAGTRSAAAQFYTITQLDFIPAGINNSGQIAGTSYDPDTGIPSVILRQTDGHVSNLGVGLGYAINDSGDITGIGLGNPNHTFLYKGGIATDLGTLGGASSVGYAINSLGQVAGMSYRTDGLYHAFVSDGTTMNDLGISGRNIAYGINSDGDVVGTMTAIGGYVGFLSRGGSVTPLGNLQSRALAINESGQVVGNENDKAFLYSDGVLTYLPLPLDYIPGGKTINDLGQIVGGCCHPLLYTGGRIVELQTRIPADSGWLISTPLGISNRGQIIGTGSFHDVQTFYLLTPISSGDFNADGSADLVWRNAATGENVLWYMNGGAQTGGATLAPVPDLNWRIVATGDFSGDGKPDLVWHNSVTGSSVVWFMEDGVQIGGATLMTVADPNWQIAAAADFNGDGWTDLVWRNVATGQNDVWYMNGAGRDSGVSLAAVPDTNWRIVGAANFNGDGTPDLVWHNVSTGSTVIWYMKGTAQIGGVTLEPVPDTNWQIVAVGDYNGDLQPDLVWRNAVTGGNVVWFLVNGVHVSGMTLESVADTDWKIAGPR